MDYWYVFFEEVSGQYSTHFKIFIVVKGTEILTNIWKGTGIFTGTFRSCVYRVRRPNWKGTSQADSQPHPEKVPTQTLYFYNNIDGLHDESGHISWVNYLVNNLSTQI